MSIFHVTLGRKGLDENECIIRVIFALPWRLSRIFTTSSDFTLSDGSCDSALCWLLSWVRLENRVFSFRRRRRNNSVRQKQHLIQSVNSPLKVEFFFLRLKFHENLKCFKLSVILALGITPKWIKCSSIVLFKRPFCAQVHARARTQPNPDAGGATTTKSRQRALLRYAVARPPPHACSFIKGLRQSWVASCNSSKSWIVDHESKNWRQHFKGALTAVTVQIWRGHWCF